MGINREQVKRIFENEPETVKAFVRMMNDANTDGYTKRILKNFFEVARRMGLNTEMYLA